MGKRINRISANQFNFPHPEPEFNFPHPEPEHNQNQHQEVNPLMEFETIANTPGCYLEVPFCDMINGLQCTCLWPLSNSFT